MARAPREEYRHISDDGMKRQTFTEWFEETSRPGITRNYGHCLDAWRARGEQDALIAESYLSDDRTSFTRNAICESIAEDIQKL